MALTVGELTAYLTVDSRGLDQGLAQAGRAMARAGGQLGDDAERAGDQAGQRLGDGVADSTDDSLRRARGRLATSGQQAGQAAGDGVADGASGSIRGAQSGIADAGRQAGDAAGDALADAATGRIRDARGRFVTAGRQAGDAAGDGMRDGASEGADGAVDGAESRLGRLKVVAAGIGLAAGAALAAGMTEALEQGRIVGRLQAQLGTTPAEAQRLGKIAGRLYSNAITEDFQGAADAIQATMRAGLLPPDATNKQIESISTRLSDVATLMDEDVSQAARAVGKMMKTGLAKDANEALDILTRGVQTGANEAEDLLDTFSEYSTQFRNMGLDGKMAMGLIRQGLKGGARDADVVADAIKEFSIEAVAGGDRVKEGFKTLGLDADEMVKKFAKGGPTAAKAFDQVLDKLRGIKDPAERNAAAIELFGTKAEDLGEALFSLDPSKAVEALGEVRGAADKAGDSLRDNAATRVEQFKRRLQQGLVDFLGNRVIPSLTKFGGFFRKIWDQAGKDTDNLPDRISKALQLLGTKIFEKIVETAPKALQALERLGQKIADWITANPDKILKLSALAGAVGLVFMQLPFLVMGAVLTAAATIVGSFAQRMIQKTNEKLSGWWNSFTGWVGEKSSQAHGVMDRLGSAIGRWFGGLWSRYVAKPVSGAWNSFIGTVKGLPGRVTSALSSLGSRLAGTASSAWNRFTGAASSRMNSAIKTVRGLPGRISGALGNLGRLLYRRGQDVVTGLWRGISSMGGWLRSTLMGWARNLIPGPIARALGIGSPSKVMAKEVGRWIPAGVAKGIEQRQGLVSDAMQRVAAAAQGAIPAPALATAGAGVPAGAGVGTSGRGTPLVRVQIDLTGGDEELKRRIRRITRIDGGGDVQLAFGR